MGGLNEKRRSFPTTFYENLEVAKGPDQWVFSIIRDKGAIFSFPRLATPD